MHPVTGRVHGSRRAARRGSCRSGLIRRVTFGQFVTYSDRALCALSERPRRARVRTILSSRIAALPGVAISSAPALGPRSKGSSTVALQWFVVEFDDEAIHIAVRRRLRRSWSADIPWDSIKRVCLECRPAVSDGIYLFTDLRPESWVVPTDATGGPELWSELIERDLFDADLAIETLGMPSGLACWPPDPES